MVHVRTHQRHHLTIQFKRDDETPLSVSSMKFCNDRLCGPPPPIRVSERNDSYRGSVKTNGDVQQTSCTMTQVQPAPARSSQDGPRSAKTMLDSKEATTSVGPLCYQQRPRRHKRANRRPDRDKGSLSLPSWFPRFPQDHECHCTASRTTFKTAT